MYPVTPAPRKCSSTPTKPLQALSQPVGELRLAQLRQVIHALLAEVDATDGQVLRGGAADALHDNRGVRLEDDAVVDNLVNGKGDEVVVFDDGALVDGLSNTLAKVPKCVVATGERRT